MKPRERMEAPAGPLRASERGCQLDIHENRAPAMAGFVVLLLLMFDWITHCSCEIGGHHHHRDDVRYSYLESTLIPPQPPVPTWGQEVGGTNATPTSPHTHTKTPCLCVLRPIVWVCDQPINPPPKREREAPLSFLSMNHYHGWWFPRWEKKIFISLLLLNERMIVRGMERLAIHKKSLTCLTGRKFVYTHTRTHALHTCSLCLCAYLAVCLG